MVDVEGLPAGAWDLAGAQERTGFPLGLSRYIAPNQLLWTNEPEGPWLRAETVSIRLAMGDQEKQGKRGRIQSGRQRVSWVSHPITAPDTKEPSGVGVCDIGLGIMWLQFFIWTPESRADLHVPCEIKEGLPLGSAGCSCGNQPQGSGTSLPHQEYMRPFRAAEREVRTPPPHSIFPEQASPVTIVLQSD